MNVRIEFDQMPLVNAQGERHLVRYVNFINSRPERKLKQTGFHTHHVYPVSLAIKNGIENYNESYNLIELTSREHFIAHMILWKCGYQEMVCAFYFMVKTFKTNRNMTTSRQYELLSKQNSEILKNRVWMKDESGNCCPIQKEEIHTFLEKGFEFGRGGASTAGKIRITNGVSNKLVDEDEIDYYKSKGYWNGQSGKSTKNKVRITKENKNITIDKNELNPYLIDGWVLGIEKHDKSKKIRITNGIENKVIDKYLSDIYLNQGWLLGTTNKPTANRKRMTNGVLNKLVISDQVTSFLEKGWTFGFTAETTKNRIHITKDNKIKFVKEEELSLFVSNDWVIKSSNKHCKFTGEKIG